MEMVVHCQDRVMEIKLRGDLDHHGAKGFFAKLEQELEINLPTVLILDFSGVAFMDSAGIAVAVRAWQRMRETGGSITLKNVAPQPRKVFQAAGVGRMMSIL